MYHVSVHHGVRDRARVNIMEKTGDRMKLWDGGGATFIYISYKENKLKV